MHRAVLHVIARVSLLVKAVLPYCQSGLYPIWYRQRAIIIVIDSISVRLIFSSFHELMQSCGVRRPSVLTSVCLSANICANRFFYQTNGWIATKLAHDDPQTGLHPGCAQSQGQRSRDTDTFVISRKSLLQVLLMRTLYEAPLHSPSSISIRQLDLMSKSWNELLRH